MSTVRGSGTTPSTDSTLSEPARRSGTTLPAIPAASSDGTSSGTNGVAMTWRFDSSASAARTRASPVAAARSCAASAAQVSNVSGPSTRLMGTGPASSTACAARSRRPPGSIAACTAARLVLVSGVPTSCHTQAKARRAAMGCSATTSQVFRLAIGSEFSGLSEMVNG